MAKAVKSDGVVNKLVDELARKSLNGTPMGKREDVDKVLKDEDKLKQCNYETLLLAGAAYFHEYKDKNWHIQKHIGIKAQQSEKFRRFMAGDKDVTGPDELTADGDSPLQKLLSR